LPDSIPQLSPEQVQERLQQTNQVILLDVRSSYEWETTPHIEGAVSMPLMDVYGNALTELDPDTEIIVMCYSGNTRSMKAAAWLQENGFENISNLDGGLRAWQQAQLPIEAANRNGDTQSDSDDDTPADNAESSHNYPSAGDQAASQNYSVP
ncbi:MAG TPA: rhodanese-like domain-containing protein, partial [Aggregatilineales bacterium]|nr:rhodanese-like domain-containing protein [Aggregatilineales bacterium]